MKTKINTILTITCFLLFSSCNTDSQNSVDSHSNNHFTEDSLTLVKMVNERETAMKKKDLATVMTQFSEDATFINSAGFYFADKKEIEKFHHGLTQSDTIGYYYTAGNVTVRLLDKNNTLVYYPWRMDWHKTSNPADTLIKEVGLMTLSAQKRNDKWLWVAITNQHTPEYFDDLTKHKRQ
jgi:uncharacterized protein (TIGR02246 family)